MYLRGKAEDPVISSEGAIGALLYGILKRFEARNMYRDAVECRRCRCRYDDGVVVKTVGRKMLEKSPDSLPANTVALMVLTNRDA